ncbi:MAG TPA: hypothetical protein VLV55_04735 [Rhizomicrobium sp.]|nr:hypothetical protein [Rhizomicrobium sp.]
MGQENRTERVSAALEGHLKRCEQMLKDCDKGMEEEGKWTAYDLRDVLSLTKASAQLAGVIARLEPRIGRRADAGPSKISESSGSIPK